MQLTHRCKSLLCLPYSHSLHITLILYRFTRDAALLQRVGQVLLQHPTTPNPQPLPAFKPRWLVAKDAFALADPASTQAIYDALSGPRFERVQALLGAPSEVEVAGDALAADGLQEPSAWVEAFRITQVTWCLCNESVCRAKAVLGCVCGKYG
jgi:hypothetical protein